MFQRPKDVTAILAFLAQWLGVVILVSNFYFTMTYSMSTLQVRNQDFRWIVSFAISAMISVLEATLFTVVFNPSLIVSQLDRIKVGKGDTRIERIGEAVQTLALGLFCACCASALWYDYTATMVQLGNSGALLLRFIGVALIIGGEMMFVCSNLFRIAMAEERR